MFAQAGGPFSQRMLVLCVQSPASKAESVEERISLRRSPAAPGGAGWADKSPDKSPEVRSAERLSRGSTVVASFHAQ